MAENLTPKQYIDSSNIKQILTAIKNEIPTTVAELTDSSNYAKTADIPTELPANGGNAATVNGYTVNANVPAGFSPNNMMSKTNPTGTGSFSLNRKAGTTIGNYSHAEGYSATASGMSSHAEGAYTTASKDYSHAEGQGTTASGGVSHAEGAYTTASGDIAHAEGNYATASGNYSHVEGSNTTASG